MFFLRLLSGKWTFGVDRALLTLSVARECNSRWCYRCDIVENKCFYLCCTVISFTSLMYVNNKQADTDCSLFHVHESSLKFHWSSLYLVTALLLFHILHMIVDIWLSPLTTKQFSMLKTVLFTPWWVLYTAPREVKVELINPVFRACTWQHAKWTTFLHFGKMLKAKMSAVTNS